VTRYKNGETKSRAAKHAVSRTQVFRWHKAFLDGRESMEDEPHSRRPCTSKTDENVTKARDLVRSDRRLTVRMISSVLNLNHQTVHEILPSNWACRKFVPSWSQKFSPMNRRKTEGMCAWTFLNALKMTKFFSNMS